MLRTHRAGKGPGGSGGWGLGSRNRRGPGMSPTSDLRRQGTSPGSPAGFLGLSGRGKCPPLLSCSSRTASPTCLSLPPQPQGCRSCLASTSPPSSVPPTSYQFTWGFLPSPWASETPPVTAGTLVVGRR